MIDQEGSAVVRATEFLRRQWIVADPTQMPTRGDRELIFRATTSTRWRRTRIDDHSVADTRRKIDAALTGQTPLEFSVPFGGYKSFRVNSNPSLNWADVFAVNFLRRYAASVKAAFPYKIIITFSYCEDVMHLVNNLPPGWQETYIREFERLLRLFTDDNIELKLFDISTLFETRKSFHDALAISAARVEREWTGLDEDLIKKRLASARRNLVIKGVENLSRVGEIALDNYILQSAKLCEALDSLDERRSFNKYSNRIQLVHVSGPKPSIHLASCDTSSNHFGIGTGVVEVRRERCLQRIITPGAWRDLPLGGFFRFEVPDSVSSGFAGLREAYLMEA